jgi:hypothetical protein
MSPAAPTWWWCLEHRKVEKDFGCGSSTRVGPYDTEQEAANAPERTRARAAEQESRDKADQKD